MCGQNAWKMMLEGRGVCSDYLPLKGELQGQIYLYIKTANLLPQSSVWFPAPEPVRKCPQ